MALKSIVESLDSVPAAIKGEYKEGTGKFAGKFVLDVEGVEGFNLEDVTELKNAVSTERARTARLSKLEKEFEGLDATDVRAKINKLDELLRIDPNKEADKIAEARIEAARVKIVEESDKRLADREKVIQRLTNGLKARTRESAIDKVLADADVLNPEAVKLKLERHIHLIETEDENNPFEITLVNDLGAPMVGDKGTNETLVGYVESLRVNPSWSTSFKPRGKNGTGSNGSTANGLNNGAKTMRRSEFNSLPIHEQSARLASGTTLTE